jgi:NAD(P)-dependent dehydrogenase (short-subunit alcohol dehydrogenase family)
MGGRLAGRSAIITGAGRGIGRAIALAFAAEGANVLVNDVDADAAASVADEAGRHDVDSATNGDAIGSVAAAEAVVAAGYDAFGEVDVLVNNAGILRDKIFHRMSWSDWSDVIAVHLHGSFSMSRAVAGHFREQNSGSFIHMTSTSGLVGNFGQANYMAAKMGIVGLSRGIALDMERFKVRSNAVAPFAWGRMIGSIPTETDEQKARLEKLKSMETAKIAPLAVYLASSNDVTGQIFAVRANEIFLMSQSRPLRSVHRADGWTPESIGAHAIPALRPHFYPLDRSQDVFSWDPL